MRRCRWGVGGFVVSVITGVQFIFGAPEQYFFNDAFRLKVVFLFADGRQRRSLLLARVPGPSRARARTTTLRAARRSSLPRRWSFSWA